MPCKFGDLGKAIKDLFSDDFDAGSQKLTLKSKSANGVEFEVEGTRDDSNAVSGELKSTYGLKNGITLKETWSTNNSVTTEVTAKNTLAKGSKVVYEVGFSPSKGITSQTVKANYSDKSVNFDSKLKNYDALTAGTVFSFSNFLVGASANMSLNKGSIKSYELAGSYSDADVVITSKVDNKAAFSGSIFHKASPVLQTGVEFKYDAGKDATGFTLGGAYKLDSTTTAKAKINKNLALGLAYTQDLRSGVTLGLSANINVKNINGDGHALGLSLGLEN